MVGLGHFLVLSGVLFGIGLFGALTRRNAIVVLMAIEVMFNAVNLAVVAMSRYLTPLALRGGGVAEEATRFLLTGQVFAVFVITVAAAEVALGLAIVLLIYRVRQTAEVTQVDSMKR